MNEPKLIYKAEATILVDHGMSNNEIFKSLVKEILSKSDIEYSEINNKRRFFTFVKVDFNGKHIGLTTEEKRSRWFYNLDYKNRYQCTSYFAVEYKELSNQVPTQTPN